MEIMNIQHAEQNRSFMEAHERFHRASVRRVNVATKVANNIGKGNREVAGIIAGHIVANLNNGKLFPIANNKIGLTANGFVYTIERNGDQVFVTRNDLENKYEIRSSFVAKDLYARISAKING